MSLPGSTAPANAVCDGFRTWHVTGACGRLTPASSLPAAHAEQVLACLQAAEADMATIHDYTAGVLRIGTLPTR
jgi:DNA-binding transcriptional LysR family regulator